MKKALCILFILITIISLGSCKKNKDKDNKNDVNQNIENTPSPSQAITPEPTAPPEITEENHEGEMRSYLSGLWVPIEVGTKRPYAIQFSNFKTVRNQWV